MPRVTQALAGLAVVGVMLGGSACHSRAQGVLPLTATPGATADGAVLSISPVDAAGPTCGEGRYRLTYRSDGLAVTGYAIVPQATTGRMPVVLFAHGGAGAGDRIGAPVLGYLASLACRGHFVVLATDYRGTHSDGADAYGGDDVDDLSNLVPVAKSLSATDSGRMAVLGFSRGGMEAYIALRRGLPVQAAAVVSGPTDLADAYNHVDGLTQHKIAGLIGGTPQSAPDAYRARSVIAWPEAIKAPLLILHGDADVRVPVAQATALDARLSALGTVHRLVIVPGGTHMLHNADAQRDGEIIGWFNAHLAGPL